MRVWEAVLARRAGGDGGELRFGLDQYLQLISQGGVLSQSWGGAGDEESPAASFEAYADQLFRANPVVFRAESFRKSVFSQARFKWRRLSDDTLFGDRNLLPLERPWPGAKTPKLLARMLAHADLGGNSFVLREPDGVSLLRPDWVTIVMTDDPTTSPRPPRVAGYMYMPGGGISNAVLYPTDQVGHFAPMPDPVSQFRGMSWLTPVVREIQGDKRTTEHKLKFFEQGATPNMVIKFDPTVALEQVKAFKQLIEDEHQGLRDAYKTMYLGGGADATVVGSNFEQLDFRGVQGKAETRILMASGVHAVLAGASEGMQGSSLNAGNYGQVRRNFSDVDLQDLFNEAAASLEPLLQVPTGAELVVDGRHIPFLQQDHKDRADIQQAKAKAIVTLVRDGFTPESSVSAVENDDFSVLQHSGLTSVQLQTPGAGENGNGSDGDSEGDDDG